MSKALPHWYYHDPMKVLEYQQEYKIKRTCVGCIFAMRVEIQGEFIMACEKGKKYGRKCKLYRCI